MSICILQNLEKYRVLWTHFSASGREINWFSDSKIGPEPAKPTISLALGARLLPRANRVDLGFGPIRNFLINSITLINIFRNYLNP